MQCPTCNEERTRVYWRPSQWIHEKPVIHSFRQCKVCDLELPPPWWHYGSNSSSSSRPTSPRTSQPAAPPADVAEHVPIEAMELIELMVGFQTEKASKFVDAWMDRLDGSPTQSAKGMVAQWRRTMQRCNRSSALPLQTGRPDLLRSRQLDLCRYVICNVPGADGASAVELRDEG